MAIPQKVSDRMVAGLKKLVPIIRQQRAKDVAEADTVTAVKAVFAEILGYDMFNELTSEFAIRGTRCDLAVRLQGELREIVEVKGISVKLNEKHLTQAVDYAYKKGIEWVILTNAVTWELHHVTKAQPITSRLVVAFDITAIDPRKESDLGLLFPFTKEGLLKGIPDQLSDRQRATSRFLISALLLHNESVRIVIRRELKKVVDTNVAEEDILAVLEAEVIKRDCLEGRESQEAVSQVRQSQKLGPKAKTSVDDRGIEPEKDQKKGPRYERFYETDPKAFVVVKSKEQNDDDKPLPPASEGFWGPIRREGLFAGKPVPEDYGWISKTVRGIGISLELKNQDCSVAIYISGEDRLERRAKILSLLPADKYPLELIDGPKSAVARFTIIKKGRKDPEHWDEARKKLVALGEDIYNKIKEAGV